LKPSELVNFIKENIIVNEKLNRPTTLNVIGESGIGKTSIVRQVFKELNYTIHEPPIVYLSESSELLGLYKEKDGYTENISMRWITEIKEKSLILLDDIWRANDLIQQSLMSFILEQRLGFNYLPKYCHIVCTNNPLDSLYNVQDIDKAQLKRMENVELDFDVKDWIKYEQLEEFETFLTQHEQMILDITPRSLSNFFRKFKLTSDYNYIKYLCLANTNEIFTERFLKYLDKQLPYYYTSEELLKMDINELSKTIKKMKSVDYEYYLIKEILKINLTDNNLNKYKELIKLFNENQKDYLEANLSSINKIKLSLL
jgi:ABC-type dipeptide/oligopeptide/nickel transport system ATPase component